MKVLRTFALAATAAAMFGSLAACGGDNNTLEGSGGTSASESSAGETSGGSTDKGSVTVGGQDFTEELVLTSIYKQVLENAGYDVTVKTVGTRDVYVPSLSRGSVDVVPDYLAGITDFLQAEENGADAPIVSSNNVEKTLAALKKLAEPRGISVLQPSSATDQNAFFVTQDFADQNNLTTLSDYAALGDPIKLGAPPDCEGRPDCEGGLTKVYGFDITQIVPLDFASAQVKDAVKSGEVNMGETGTTDGTLDALGLVILEDDKGIQPAQNLTPVVNTDFLDAHPDIPTLLDPVSQALTTEDLAALNLKVDANREKPDDVAAEWLQSKGLI
jgi:osmoprotectant transport system substrate-binding protein